MKKRRLYRQKRKYNPLYLKEVSQFTLAYLIFYIWWRISFTLNPDALFISWVLLLAEAFGIFNYSIFSWMTQDTSPIYNPKKAPEGKTVDVFVPTYNESLEILEITLTGCVNLTYPHTTYVLDDGNRPEVKKLAHQMGCKYIARTKNLHAKAGNINNALEQTNGEFIILLDADMAPQPDFIERTLGYFKTDENLAFIQTPQEFYNQNSIQHNKEDSPWHEQSLFFRVIQPGKNYSNSAFWCGSPSILRRKALESVGGVATETITEDIHTSVRFHSQGWNSLFLNEVLAFGIAPQTIKAFLLQRLRWAQGTMQLYRSKESPLWIPGLTVKQRISYLASSLAYFESYQKLIFILMPAFIIIFNIFPIRTNLLPFFVFWIPYYILTMVANKIGGRGYYKYYLTEKYNLLKMIVFIQSTLTLFSKKQLKFRVTPKSVENSVYRDEKRELAIYMALFGLIAGVVLFGFLKLILMKDIPISTSSFVVALLWAAYNAGLILISILSVIQKPHDRKEYRFNIIRSGQLVNYNTSPKTSIIRLDNISLHGAGFIINKKISKKDDVLLRIHTHGRKSINLPIKKIHSQKRNLTGKYYVGVSFSKLSKLHRKRLIRYLFIDTPRERLLAFPTPEIWEDMEFIQKVFRQPLSIDESAAD